MTRARCRLSSAVRCDGRRSGRTQSGQVDVTVVEFPAHTAYLDPRSGTGYLLTPPCESDVAPLVDPLVEAVWSECLHDHGRGGGLSLHAADRREALAALARAGWELLYDDEGEIEEAGWTIDGRLALCLCGTPPPREPCLDTLSRSLTALDLAAGIEEECR